MLIISYINKAIKKNNLYYIVIIILAIIFAILYYPRIYGVDAFQLIWMAKVLQDGALFSENTWLISPFSYFGYYPFSHRAIGVPIFLAFLINFLSFISFGTFGLNEAILVLNIILILIIYKTSRSLANIIFEEEWSKFTFVAVLLLSPNVLDEITMTVSTRIIITIVMIVLLTINLKIINKSIHRLKAAFLILLILFIGALAHRLWIVTIISVIFMFLIIFVAQYKALEKTILYLILPITILAFFIGLEIFGNIFLIRIDPHNLSPFFDVSDLVGKSALLVIFYGLATGLILIFFPLGVILTIYNIASSLNNNNSEKRILKEMERGFIQKEYLLLFLIPFFFMLPANIYTIFIFLPIVIIFSIYGLIYFKELVSSFSKKLVWLIPLFLYYIFFAYNLIRLNPFSLNNLLLTLFLSSVTIGLFLLISILKNKNLNLSNIFSNPIKIWTTAILLIILISSATHVESKKYDYAESPYPWENNYLTNEEIEVINFFQNEDVSGFIFSDAGKAGERIGYIGSLPIFCYNRTYYQSEIGTNLYYGFITKSEVYKYTEFSLDDLIRLEFFTYFPKTYYWESLPLEVLKRKISVLNSTNPNDLNLLEFEFNIQYIISVNKTFLSENIEQCSLISSLEQSEALKPIFSTKHLLVWKIY